MPERDLDLLIRAAQASGEVARGYAERGARSWEKADSAGPVTEADLAVNDLLIHELRSARPDYGWLSEETEDEAARLKADRCFIVDPIDGTRSFIEGSKHWAHSLAIAEAGEIVAAVVYLPMPGLLYTAAKGEGACLNGQQIRVSERTELIGADILTTRPVMEPENWRDGHVPDFIRSYRPSLAYRMCLIAEGRYDGMITLRRTWEWDVAAGALIISEAGGVVTDRTGTELRFNNAIPSLDGVVTAPLMLHRQALDALTLH